MHLTSLAFHTTFAVLLFILVVVFQEDLRRMLERVSTLRSVKFRRSTSIELDVDGLVEAVFKMGATRMGALIVLKGTESLERHLGSGIPLGGLVSRPLLYSIFDSGSPGHDGAAIIEHDRIEQFAAHLPISKDRKEIAGRGTRHCAALGLSERSDALAIVVSEERGVVSIAEAGKLKEIATAAALKNRLERFLTATSPGKQEAVWSRIIMHHGGLKMLAMVIAIVAWYILAYDPNTIQRTFVVPIEYRNVPPELVLDDTAPNEAQLPLPGRSEASVFSSPRIWRCRPTWEMPNKGYRKYRLPKRVFVCPQP